MWQGRWVGTHTRVNCVAIVGGTHGNETTGVYLQRALADACVRGDGFEVLTLEASPEAVRLNRRYVDEDLNRCFALSDLVEEPHAARSSSERRRARELDAQLGPKSSPTPRAELVLDLHNTTSNVGVALMMHPRDAFGHALAAYLQRVDPRVRVCTWRDEEPALLPSVGRSGMTFEVGPAPWGVLVPDLFWRSLRLLHATLTYVTAHNACVDGRMPRELRSVELEVYHRLREVGFPRTPSGDIAAMPHKDVHMGDFGALRIGDALFQRWDGSEITHDGPEGGDDLTFFFANEAAYYEKDVALVLARRRRITVQTLRLP